MTIDSKMPNPRSQIVAHGQGGAADPLGALIAVLGEDPLIADFIALRRSRPDLREAAFRARAHQLETVKLLLFKHLREISDHRAVLAGIELLAQAYQSQVAIWPTDSASDAIAKLSLHRDPMEAASVRGTDARRIRLELAALNPGYLIVPAAPSPHATDRALDDRHPWEFDLPAELADLPSEASYSLSNHKLIAKFAWTEPDLDAFARTAASYFSVAARLMIQATRPGSDRAELADAAEGAIIAAYTLCGRVGLWPARKNSADMAAKVAVQALLNKRATTLDPLHMQAAARMCFSAGESLARHQAWRFDRTPLPEPWIENV